MTNLRKFSDLLVTIILLLWALEPSLAEDFAAVRSNLEQAVDSNKEAFGEDHPNTTMALHNLMLQEAALGNWEAAGNREDTARRGIRRHVARVLPTLSETEQLTFLRKTDEDNFHTALSLGWLRRDERDAAARSAGWLLNGKGIAHVALAEQALLAREARNSQSAMLVTQLRDIRGRLAQLSLTIPKTGTDAGQRQQREALNAQENELVQKLAKITGRAELAEPWVELAAVRRALTKSSLLVDIARFREFDFQAKGEEPKWKSACYVAWIIPPAGVGDVQVVNLGEAQTIDERIEQVRQLITNVSVLQQGEPEAVRKVQEQLTALANQIWMPLAPHIGDAQNLLLSPDASLWLVPWGALPTGKADELLIEKFTINYLVSGRDVANSVRQSVHNNLSTIFANPDFDLSPLDVKRRIKVLLRDQTPKEEETPVRPLPKYGKGVLPKGLPLPGTEIEARAIAAHLKSLTGSEPQVQTGRDSLESVVKAIRSPRVVVLSTHAFVLPDQDPRKSEQLPSKNAQNAAVTVDGKALENPFLRCGFLFAGCNDPSAGLDTAGDDGVLTGLEIVGLDLSDTELAVLSAGKTGLGQVRSGEGVVGLRQAFQLAGAKAVVASLWDIPDAETARLMNDFFANLAAGQSRGDALRNAQLKRIAARRDKFGAAHPFFWAAFTLTGQ